MFSSQNSQVSSAANYIEDVFSTYLYTGNSTSGGTQTITNSIDLSTKGGMVWIKGRSAASNHILTDTTRGAGTSATNNNALASNLTSAEDLGGSSYDYLSSFSTTGFVVTQGGTTTDTRGTNYNNVTYASWTFRKQPKFFDVVTYTGNGTASRAISHSLGSAPAVMIVKQTDGTRSWPVYHRSVPTGTGYLNTTQEFFTGSGNGVWGDSAYNNIAPTSTVFYVGSDSEVNGNGLTYVAYLFAHDAGGFGLTGTDNVISCGSFTTTGAVVNVTLGYEPQFLLVKRTDAADDWRIIDSMRGFTTDKNDQILAPNLSAAETNLNPYIGPTATGFSTAAIATGRTYIYIAIRRGPMKVPTSGTSVFGVTLTENASAPYASSAFPVDLGLVGYTSGGGYYMADRLRGAQELVPSSTAAESAAASYKFDYQNGWLGGAFGANLFYTFKRAPSFFDEVCYTGTGSARTISHNLGAVPELMIVKERSGLSQWYVYASPLGNTKGLWLNTTGQERTGDGYWNDTTPTSSVFSLGGVGAVNTSGDTYVNYLFASCAGVSKVGSYTGTGALQTINCGFTGGARFVLIKRTDDSGDWYVYDSSRGLTSGNDPYFLMNSSAAQVTGTNYVDTDSTGFKVTAAAPAGLNASGGTYIFLAIA